MATIKMRGWSAHFFGSMFEFSRVRKLTAVARWVEWGFKKLDITNVFFSV